MTIDWTLPVETTEDPPRPVRVLFDSEGNFANIVKVGPVVYVLYHQDLFARIGQPDDRITLRNAPPKPEPVMLEGWLNLYRNGALTVHFSDDDAQVCNPNGAAETRRIAWMSDGSPVPSEASGEEDPTRYGVCEVCVEKAVKSADEWRTKAEALQAEVDRQKPVVDAAVAWTNAEGNEAIILTGRALMDASRAYQSKQAPAELVKNCETCKNGPHFGCNNITCGAKIGGYRDWEPRHD